MTVSLRIPANPAGEPQALPLLTAQAAKLAASLDQVQQELRLLLGRPLELTDLVASYKAPGQALRDLGPGAQANTLFDAKNHPVAVLAADLLFLAISGAWFMRMPLETAEERIQAKEVTGVLLDSAAEVLNVGIGALGRGLSVALRDKTFCFPRDVRNDATGLPDSLLVIAAAVRIDGFPSGRLELWVSQGLLARLGSAT